jgi:ketosteroid isomerase-like protein
MFTRFLNIIKKINLSIFLSLFWTVLGQAQKLSTLEMEAERAEILRLHQQQRAVHFEKNAAVFAEMLADPHLSVGKGSVRKISREAARQRFGGYFQSVDFIRWDDAAAPILKISDDGSMAYTVVEKDVQIRYANPNGDSLEEKTRFAWLAVYEKLGGQWLITCNISTNREPEIRLLHEKTTHSRLGMEVLAAVAKFAEGFERADTAALSAMLSEKYLHTNGSAPPLRKTAWLNYVAARRAKLDSGEEVLKTYQNEDIVVEVFGENTAVVQGVNLVEGTRNGQFFRSKIRFTQVWVLENGGWKRAAFHDGKME